MAKIVIDAREYSTSTGRYISKLIENLQNIDDTNKYIILIHKRDAGRFKSTSKNFTVKATQYKEFTFGEQLGFAWQLYKLKPDLVHFGMVQQPLLYFGCSVTTMHDLTTVRFRNPTKNRLVFTIKQQVYKFVNIWAAHKNKLIIAPTEFVKKDITKYTHINKDKIVVTYESADAITDNPKPIESLVDKQFIFYIGRPLPHKNLGRLIDAFAILRKNNPNLLLVIAGKKDAIHDDYLEQAKNLGVDETIMFPGFVSEANLRWLYENTACYVFASLSEGFGLPGLEAMAHGAPVASSNATCLPEVYDDAAHYFDPLNINDMANKINEVINDKKLRGDLIEKGYKQAKKYSWQTMAKQTLDVYKKALD